MSYDLYIGDKTFSSWSLRGWLMLEKFGLTFQEHMVGLYAGTMAEDLSPLAPARLVPVLRTPDDTVVGESLAMAETLAERQGSVCFRTAFAEPVARQPFSGKAGHHQTEELEPEEGAADPAVVADLPADHFRQIMDLFTRLNQEGTTIIVNASGQKM